MQNLQLPHLVTVHITSWAIPGFEERPFHGLRLAFVVKTFVRQRNDYRLGPFFSEGDLLQITGAQFEASVHAYLDWGLMDYANIREAFPLVEIRPLWAPEIQRALDFRKSGELSEHEAQLWGTRSKFVELLQSCGNQRLKEIPDGTALGRIRDEWDGSKNEYEYTLGVHPSAAA
jgi:hypothetical protein